MLWWFAGLAHASSLDLIEVGGAFGTVAATNPSAVWWNPAGLAVASGSEVMVEVAPTIGQVRVDRDNPDYGVLDTTGLPAGFPDTYDYSGSDRVRFVGPLPFVGARTDLGVDGLGIGAALFVPFARAGSLDDPNGPSRYFVRDGTIQTVYGSLAAAYQFGDVVSVGVSGSIVSNRFDVDTDVAFYPDLLDGARFAGFDEDELTGFQDGYSEQPGYSVTSIFDLADTAFTFGAGIYVTPSERLGISLGYQHGLSLENEGDLTLNFACPPDYDTIGRRAAEDIGTCDTSVSGTGMVSYRLPGRVQGGIAWRPTDGLRIELMGAVVFWSVFTDYDIQPLVAPSAFTEARGEGNRIVASDLASVFRPWARDNRTSGWIGADVKGSVASKVVLGGRAIFDRAAVPDSTLSANNFDADSLALSGLVDITPIDPLSVSLTVGHQVLARRTVTDSAFAIWADRDARPADPRYFYPSANGVYRGSITRIGITARARLGKASATAL